jgi:hypothetical protein
MCLYTTCRAVSLVLLLAAIGVGSSLAQEAQDPRASALLCGLSWRAGHRECPMADLSMQEK